MTAGFDWNEDGSSLTDTPHHETRMYWEEDPAGFVLAQSLVSEPGTRWEYSGGLTTLLGYVISRATGQHWSKYAREKLFTPLGITQVEWGWAGKDAAGGGGENAWKGVPELHWEGSESWSFTASPPYGLWIRPRDLLKIGSVYLNGGVWNGERILSEAWVGRSLQPLVELPTSSWEHGEGTSSHHGHGYQWFHVHYQLPYGEVDVPRAQGNGGQRIWVLPELGLTAVHVTGNYNKWSASYQADRLLLERIVPWALGIEATYEHELQRSVLVVDKPGAWPMVELTAAERAIYVGHYDDEGLERRRIEEVEGVLRVSLPGSGVVHLIPGGNHIFAVGRLEDGQPRKIFWPAVRMHFILDDQGEVVRYEWRVVETGELDGRAIRVQPVDTDGNNR